MAEELEEKIETAEEAGDSAALLNLIGICTSHGGDSDWTDVAESSLDAFYRLTKSNNSSSSSGTNDTKNAMSSILASLEAWKEEEAIVEVALGCIVALACQGGFQEEEDQQWNVQLVWDMMQAFPDEATIQEQACLAVEGLALASEHCQKALKNAVDCPKELAAARERITNERNKAYPGRAAKALGISLE